jgi:hypothetical protein
MVEQRRLFKSGRIAAASLAIAAASAASLDAATVAYWRFEGDGVATPTDGAFLRDTNGRTAVQPDGIPAIDVSGNGNTLYTWDNNGTGHQYRPNVPPTTALKSGLPNDWSIQNNGGFPASFTWSQQSNPTGVNLHTWTPTTWTIEASINATAMGGWRTFVGREGNGVNPGEAGLAPLYFQAIGGDLAATPFNDIDHVRIQFVDATGTNHMAVDPIPIVANQWYHYAASSDGNMLRLYKDQLDGAGYQLVASTDISASANRALINPGVDANGDSWGWTVGRGRYGTSDNPNDNHVDRWPGYIDEVRLSDVALDPSQLLFTPMPDMALVVNKNTGAVAIRNVSNGPITFDYYQIESPDPDGPGGSPGGALSVAGWSSLSDQNVDGGLAADFNGVGGVNGADLTVWKNAYGANANGDANNDGVTDGADFLTWQRQFGQTAGEGDSWDESAGSSNTILAELFLNGATTLAPGAQLAIGNAFNTSVFGAGVNGNLSFKYGVQGEQALSGGGVNYVTTGPIAAVPEPASLLMAAGMGAMVCGLRLGGRRKS